MPFSCRKTTPFRAAYKKNTGREADVYAVQGYDTGQLLAIGLAAVKGGAGARQGAGRGAGDRPDRQPVRRIYPVQGAQPDPRHLSAQVVGMENGWSPSRAR